MSPKLILRLAMLALIVATLGNYFIDPKRDFVRGLLYGVAIGMMLWSVVLMRRRGSGRPA